MVYFNSDYLEGAHPALMAKLNETNMVQTVGYGEDEYCAAAREKIKAACGAPEADVHFLVGGTQTNTTVIASILRPWQGVLLSLIHISRLPFSAAAPAFGGSHTPGAGRRTDSSGS